MEKWQTIADERHFNIARSDDVIRVVRSSQPFDTLREILEVHRALVARLDAVDRAALGLLYDLRDAQGRNDPAFESAIAPIRPRIWAEWGRISVLVRTAIGAMQIRRHLAEDGIRASVFTDDAEAAAHLQRS